MKLYFSKKETIKKFTRKEWSRKILLFIMRFDSVRVARIISLALSLTSLQSASFCLTLVSIINFSSSVDEIPSHRKSNLKWKLTKTKELIELFEDARTHTHARTGLAGAKMRFSVAPISNRRFPRRYVAIRSPAPDLFATQRAQPVVIFKTNSPNFAQLMVVHCWRLRCVEHII